MHTRTLVANTLFFSALAATASAQAKHLPSPPDEGIARAQTFDRGVPDPSVYKRQVYFIWGSQKPANPAPALGSKYLPYSRDPDRAHTLEWYQQNHPDWIEYKADRTTPAYGFLYTHGNNMSIDITNPEVREFYWNNYVQPAIDAGYRIFAFDNVDLVNGARRAGHFDKKGIWVQQFSGENIDDAYVAAVLDWIHYLTARLHAEGIGVAANITFPLGKPQLEPAMRSLVEMVDLWGDEQGFTHHSDANIADAAWEQKFKFLRSIGDKRLYWAINETTTKHLADASPSQIDYAVANYYLYRERGSMLTVCGIQEYGVFLDTPAMHVDLGHPLGAPVQESGGAWVRIYSNGMVIVNPSSKLSVKMQLKGGTWIDSHGVEHVGKLEVTPVSAYLLVKKPIAKY